MVQQVAVRATVHAVDNETVERPLRPQGLKDLPLDARPRRAHQERLAAWGLLFGVFPGTRYRASPRAHALQPLGPPGGQPRPGGPKTAGENLTGKSL